ncbi:hypothetical protein [uncultured Lamprocystis sp.]|jgi:hypothetical protein|uniref:hypothetical protein n=1 Tax=uncultured Lamprocystis sp. TaxID=543132 RepID=UPI0025D4370A|nr:hypothetical protein [uncultured Lamprocystis sp.]
MYRYLIALGGALALALVFNLVAPRLLVAPAPPVQDASAAHPATADRPQDASPQRGVVITGPAVDDGTAAANPRSLSELESIKASVAALRADVRKTREAQAQAQMATAQDDAASTDALLNLNDAALLAVQKEEIRRMAQLAENSFYAQPVNHHWADATTDRIESALTSEAARAIPVDQIECRSSLCRLEIGGAGDGSDIEAFKRDFRDQVADVLTAGMVVEDDSGRMTVYLGRDNDAFSGLGTEH